MDRYLEGYAYYLGAVLGKVVYRLGISHHVVSVVGFLFSVLGAFMIAHERYLEGLILFLGNRLFDVIDGAVARMAMKESDFGRILDVTLDLCAYSLTVMGFAFTGTEEAVAAAVLLASFMGTSSSFLSYAVVFEKRVVAAGGVMPDIYDVGGIAGSTVSTTFICLFCIFQEFFVVLAYIFAGLCVLTTIQRVSRAHRFLPDED